MLRVWWSVFGVGIWWCGGGCINITGGHNYYLVGPMLYTKTYIYYPFLLTIFGPINYDPPVIVDNGVLCQCWR